MINNKESKSELLQQIRSINFIIVELAEYLDTHNNDKKAIELHNDYSMQLQDLSEKYQKKYGPLSIYYPNNSWKWAEEPWPWERGK